MRSSFVRLTEASLEMWQRSINQRIKSGISLAENQDEKNMMKMNNYQGMEFIKVVAWFLLLSFFLFSFPLSLFLLLHTHSLLYSSLFSPDSVCLPSLMNRWIRNPCLLINLTHFKCRRMEWMFPNPQTHTLSLLFPTVNIHEPVLLWIRSQKARHELVPKNAVTSGSKELEERQRETKEKWILFSLLTYFHDGRDDTLSPLPWVHSSLKWRESEKEMTRERE